MDIRFVGKNIDVTEGMKTHLEERVLRMEKYAPKIVEAHIVLETEKYLFKTEVTLLAKNLRAYGEASSKENIFAAIDQACARVEKQIKKFRDKVKDHHKRDVEYVLFSEESDVDEVFEQLDEEAKKNKKPEIIQSSSYEPKPMPLDEASMQLHLSPDKNMMVFLNTQTGKTNVLLKREDGNHELIAPEY